MLKTIFWKIHFICVEFLGEFNGENNHILENNDAPFPQSQKSPGTRKASLIILRNAIITVRFIDYKFLIIVISILGITGDVNIDENGDRIADYSLLDMDPETSKFEVRKFILTFYNFILMKIQLN